MKNISVSPELNPKVNGNSKFEHYFANTKLFSLFLRMSRDIRHTYKGKSIFRVFILFSK